MALTADSTIDVLTHVDFEGPGAIGDRAERAGMTVRTHALWDGAPVPSLDSIQRLVIMGGPMGACDDEAHPMLVAERALLHAAVDQGTPVLGVCLGAQLLAAALGADVFRGPEPEIGAGQVTLTSEGALDPVLGAAGATVLPVFHWHGDTFDLPPGAVRLAESDAYPNQAFRVEAAYGLQFHVELRARDVESVRAHLGRAHTVTSEELAIIEPYGRLVIDAFLATT